jgi:asparagine synthase (glutamine-hydrolysing)
MFPRDWTPDYSIETCNAIRPNMAGGRERYSRIAANAATEARDPFMDKRVLEYCTRLPGHLRMKDGWHKSILRKAMVGQLPDEVRWSSGKPHLGWLFNATITRLAVNDNRLDSNELQAALGDYVDSAALAKAWQVFSNGGDADRIHTAHVLCVWLQENVNRPVAPK